VNGWSVVLRSAVIVLVVVVIVVEWYERKTPVSNVLRRRSLARLRHTSGASRHRRRSVFVQFVLLVRVVRVKGKQFRCLRGYCICFRDSKHNGVLQTIVSNSVSNFVSS